MVICHAEKRHIPGMIRLLRQVGAIHAQGRPDLFCQGAQKYNEAQLEEILADPLSPIFIAEEEGLVLGYCFCQRQTIEENACLKGRKELYIDDLCVDATAVAAMWVPGSTAMCRPGPGQRALTTSRSMYGALTKTQKSFTAPWEWKTATSAWSRNWRTHNAGKGQGL